MAALTYNANDGMEAFRIWLVRHGAALEPPTNEFECARARTRLGFIIVHRRKSGRYTFGSDNARALYETMRKGVSPKSLADPNPTLKSSATKLGRRRTQALRACLIRDHYRCFYCNEKLAEIGAVPPEHPRAPTLEHLVAVAHGGPDHPSNHFPSCGGCNVEAGSLDAVQKIALRERKRRPSWLQDWTPPRAEALNGAPDSVHEVEL